MRMARTESNLTDTDDDDDQSLNQTDASQLGKQVHSQEQPDDNFEAGVIDGEQPELESVPSLNTNNSSLQSLPSPQIDSPSANRSPQRSSQTCSFRTPSPLFQSSLAFSDGGRKRTLSNADMAREKYFSLSEERNELIRQHMQSKNPEKRERLSSQAKWLLSYEDFLVQAGPKWELKMRKAIHDAVEKCIDEKEFEERYERGSLSD